jgi:membrane protein YqaA with SNARE-associated domain
LLAQNNFLLKITAWIAFLKTLGAWGLMALAAVDSGTIPIPIDALVAGYVFSNPGHAWLYVLAAAVGSSLGCLVPYYVGRVGGEMFLLKRIDEQKLTLIRERFQRQEFFALMVPAMLPPPTPFKLFALSAGVFEMRLAWYLGAIIAGRLVRFGVLAVLTVIFGPQIVTQIKFLVKHHPSLAILIGLVVVALGYLVFRLVQAPMRELAGAMNKKEEKSS